MLLPKSFLDDLRMRVRLSDVIGARVKLTRAGREFRACCPFHNEKSPSFYVNDEKGFFHCFGCGAHGDQIGFLMRQQNLGFMDAVESLAAQAGMPVPKPSVQDVERSRTRDRLIALMEVVTKWYAAQLFDPKYSDVLEYLRGRGLAPETIEAFRLGYAPEGGPALAAAIREAGYTMAEAIEAGVFKTSTREGGAPYPFFRDRVIFPVCDRRGQTIAFGGRVLPSHLRPLPPGQAKPPKYINSGETPLFQKGHVLYNESRARAAAARDQRVIVCEGYADVIALWQAGFAGAVAPLGTALTEAQIGSLWSMIPESADTGMREPILCFDGDAAGQRAATRAMERILPQLQAGRSARFAFLPDGQDPDDLVRERGAPGFEAILDTAIPMVEMIWRTLTQGRHFDTPEGRAGLEKSIRDLCAHIADAGVQRQYAAALKERFFQAFKPARQAPAHGGYGAGRRNAAPPAPAVRLPDPRASAAHARACVALAAVLYFPEIFPQAEDSLGRLHIEEPGLDGLRQAMLDVLAENHTADHDRLVNIMKEKGFSEVLDSVARVGIVHGIAGRYGGDAGSALAGLQEAVGASR